MIKHLITNVIEESVASEYGLVPGDFLLSINGNEIEDVFDYRYLCQDSVLKLLVEKQDGTQTELDVLKDENDDLGLEFSEGLMDDYRSCSNKCIFCFIDQMPKGMRETLYFKDDDMRLSFLQGNYVTLTNMSEKDLDRIIKYKLEPINVSFQTTNPELRCMMLHNRFAGDALKKVDRLFENNIKMNGQIVLCKGVNDGAELERSLSDLYRYFPVLESVSVVPVGLSKYRDGLYPLEPFEKQDAIEVLETIHKWQEIAFNEHGLHFVHASDEWYITAGLELPDESNYDGYLQIENGVGMIRSLIEEFNDGILQINESLEQYNPGVLDKLFIRRYNRKFSEETGVIDSNTLTGYLNRGRSVSIVSGMISAPYIKKLCDNFMDLYPDYKINVYPIRNDFFGERITVSGLLTAQDIIAQLKDKELGDCLLLPENMLRANTDVFLDDLTVGDVEKSLHSKTHIVKSNGKHLIESIIGEKVYV